MALSEFEIISRYFQRAGLAADLARHRNVALGIGDDCALLTVPRGKQLALSMDVLVEGVHFPVAADPSLVAWRALSVNLSDLAAMGAEPLCFTLGLTMPSTQAGWLEAFSVGLRDCAQKFGCPLVGGNLTQGPLQIAIQVQGLVPKGAALLRSGAKAGQDVFLSGMTGRAGLALQWLEHKCVGGFTDADREELMAAYYQPTPQLALGKALRGIASAAQDVSDGLVADIGHIAKASGVCITLDITRVPVSRLLTSQHSSTGVFELALTAGDDYELVFTAPAGKKRAVAAAAAKAGVLVTRIGKVCKGNGVTVLDPSGQPMEFTEKGYEHFT